MEGFSLAEYYYLHRDDVEKSRFNLEDKNCYLDENGQFIKFDDMISQIKAKDTVFIHNITNLGTDFNDMTIRWREILEKRKAEIVTESNPIIDTRKLQYSRLEYFIYLLHLSEKINNDTSYREKVRKKQLRCLKFCTRKGAFLLLVLRECAS